MAKELSITTTKPVGDCPLLRPMNKLADGVHCPLITHYTRSVHPGEEVMPFDPDEPPKFIDSGL